MTGRHRWATFVLAPLLVLAAWPAALAVEIYRYSFETCALPAGAAVVLGAAVWNDRPSPVFEERIRHGLELYHTGRVQTLVMTGGRSDGDLLAEAEAARAYVLARGVAAQDVLWERESGTTRENLLGARELLGDDPSRVAIVSDPLHMKRAVTMAQDLGLHACPSPTPTSRYRSWPVKLRFLGRETFYYASYLLRRPFLTE